MKLSKDKKDKIFAESKSHIGDFIFDKKVVDVFEDMINRSVPGYQSIISMIGVLAEKYVQANSLCYDLGASLGAATVSMANSIQKEGVRIVSVDNSKPMIDQLQKRIKTLSLSVPVDTQCLNIQDVNIENASMVVLNYVLQFVSVKEREPLLKRICDGLKPGGILVLSEKIVFQNQQENEIQIALHEEFKRMNGYSDLEISQKRKALEDVLIPDGLLVHEERLRKVGFNQIHVWFQCFNFVSIIAFKS